MPICRFPAIGKGEVQVSYNCYLVSLVVAACYLVKT